MRRDEHANGQVSGYERSNDEPDNEETPTEGTRTDPTKGRGGRSMEALDIAEARPLRGLLVHQNWK
jgi:hypothetical protein